MKKKKLEQKVEDCLKNNGSKQVKENPEDVVGMCTYGMPLPCNYQTTQQCKKDYFGCMYVELKGDKFPDDYFGS